MELYDNGKLFFFSFSLFQLILLHVLSLFLCASIKLKKEEMEKIISAVGCLNVTQNLFNLLILVFSPLHHPLGSYSGRESLCAVNYVKLVLLLLLLLMLMLTYYVRVMKKKKLKKKKSVVEIFFFHPVF